MGFDDVSTLRTQVLAGLEKRTDKYLIEAYNARKDQVTDMLPVSGLSDALREM